MERKEYTTIDKSTWGEGPWAKEPDKVQWQDRATGLPCLAVRHPSLGHWCGYVGVDTNHKFFGKHYDGTDAGFSVHGGLTFADKCHPHDTEATGICHVPGESEPDHVWWFGFDCAHSGDFSPGLDLTLKKVMGDKYREHPEDKYRTLAFVKKECRKLAEQLHDRRAV